jgi:hypothetical protein
MTAPQGLQNYYFKPTFRQSDDIYLDRAISKVILLQ